MNVRGSWRQSCVLAATAFAAAMTTVSVSWAHNDPDESTKDSASTYEPAPPKPEGTEEERRFTAGLDLVIGFGKEDVVTQTLPGSLLTAPTNVIAPVKTLTESFLLSGAYEVKKGFDVGLRLPLTLGTLSSVTSDSRQATALGALELEAEYEREVQPHFEIIGAFSLSLPTAQGEEPTAADLGPNGGTFNQTTYDRYSVNRAAAASRGWSDNALFTPKTIGLIPRIAGRWTQGKITFEAYAKYDALISTVTDADHSFEGDLVLGARGGYVLNKYVEAGARVWTTIPLGNADATAVAVVEPEIRAHVDHLSPYVAAILPFAGPITNPYFAGLRLGITALF
jgi:hypothetical protein